MGKDVRSHSKQHGAGGTSSLLEGRRRNNESAPSRPLPLPTVQYPPTLSDAFANRTVALLLLGEAFRSGSGGERDTPCQVSSINAQHEATQSYLHNVIRPLERLGARAEVLFTFPWCGNASTTRQLRGVLEAWLAPHVVHTHTERSPHFDGAWAMAYRMLLRHMDRRAAPYDYVLHARHDLYIDVPIDR